MIFQYRVAAVFAFLSVFSGLAHAGQAPAKPQYLVISFDGAHDLAQWERSRALANETGARFTYFLSCVFLLSGETKRHYSAPGMSAGRSNVGFAATSEEVGERLHQIWTAWREGHEIASHGCGHFDGKDWTRADWSAEFDQFRSILGNAFSINGIATEPQGWQRFAKTAITGFRAPYLSTNAALGEALADAGMAYDASTVSREPEKPQLKGGVWRFSLPLVPEGPSLRRVIAMDYNLFVRHSGGIERKDEGSVFEDRAYHAFRNAFDREYAGARRPLQIGFHFTLMNDGAYWRALERLARDLCGKADVECVTYSQLLDTLKPAQIGG